LAVGALVSVVFLYLTLRRVDLGGVGQALGSVSLPMLSLALLTKGSSFLALGLRSRFTVAPSKTVRYQNLVLSHLLGYTGNNVLPFRLGEILRIDYLARRSGVTRSFLVGAAAVERLMDSVVLLLLFAATVPMILGPDTLAGSFPALAGATAFALVVAVGVSRWAALPDILERAVRPVHPGMASMVGAQVSRASAGLSGLSHARLTPGAGAATLLYWLSGVASLRVVIAAFGLTLPWYGPFFIIAVTALGTALPSSPGFVGTYHYFSALAVSLLGADPATSTSFAIVAHAVAVVPFTVLGLLAFAPSIRGWAHQDVPPSVRCGDSGGEGS
jgi:uncharacterized membrane protein YbhN (UPF0104 family)